MVSLAKVETLVANHVILACRAAPLKRTAVEWLTDTLVICTMQFSHELKTLKQNSRNGGSVRYKVIFCR